MTDDARREQEIRDLVGKLAALEGKERARLFALSWWSDRLLSRAMADEQFRVRLFRFVDVYPALRGQREVLEHLRDEFAGAKVPWWFSAGLALGRLPGGPALPASAARRGIDRMAHQFVLGEKSAQVAHAAARMWEEGTTATVDLLGEHTHSDSDAWRYAARLADLVDVLGTSATAWPARPELDSDSRGRVPRASVSVKVSALSPAFATLTAERALARAEELLLPILERARDLGVWVWFDMERYEAKAVTHRLFRDLAGRPELEELYTGIVVQAYLRDAADDLASLARWAEGRRIAPGVRLVKGAYWDTETIEAGALGWEAPVHLEKFETDVAYEELAQQLHSHHRSLRGAFASHNLRSLAAAVVDGRRAGIADRDYELQLLYGMAEPVHDAVRRAGLRLRVYTPMGELVPGMAYLVRRLLENTSNESFVRRHFAEHESLDELVQSPLEKPAEEGRGGRRRSATRRRRPRRQRPEGRGELTAYRPEPLTPWHLPGAREAMAEAVEAEFVGREVRRVPALVGSEQLTTTATLVSVDPAAPASTVALAADCGPGEVSMAVFGAQEAAASWRRTPVAERVAAVLRLAQVLRSRRMALAALIVREVGKGWDDADAEVCEAIDYCEYYGRRMLVLEAGGEVQSPPGEENRLRYRGRGVAAVVAPWNFPLAIPTGMSVGALVTGNAVVLKPAEQSPAVAGELAAACAEAGFPTGVFSLVPGGPAAGEALVSHPQVDVVAFTGSRQVGLSIIETAARRDDRRHNVVRVVAEMGGKNPIVVDEDADLDEVVPAVMRSAFGFAGQKCSAASRVVAVGRVHDALVKRLAEAVTSLDLGPPRFPGSQMGPVIDAESHSRLTEVVSRLGDFGTPVVVRGDVPADGFFVGPALVTDVDPLSWLATTELFGPVLAVFRASDFDAAVAVADAGDYALTAGVFSRSPGNVKRALDGLRAGNVYVNRAITGAVVGRQPFGGNALSGVGSKAGGPDYLLQFCDPQVTAENTVRQGYAGHPSSTMTRGPDGQRK